MDSNFPFGIFKLFFVYLRQAYMTLLECWVSCFPTRSLSNFVQSHRNKKLFNWLLSTYSFIMNTDADKIPQVHLGLFLIIWHRPRNWHWRSVKNEALQYKRWFRVFLPTGKLLIQGLHVVFGCLKRFLYQMFVLFYITRRVPLVQQELFTLSGHLSSSPVPCWACVAQSFVCRWSLFAFLSPFPVIIVFSILLWSF
jgi:hypothetical protein